MTRLKPSIARLIRHPRFSIALVFLIALGLRIGYVTLQTNWPAIGGGDYHWYADYGSTLVRTGRTLGPPPTGPIFLLVAGYAEQLTPPDFPDQNGWLLQRMVAGPRVFPDPVGRGAGAIRLLNALLGSLTVIMVYRIGRVAWSKRAGRLAALLVAIGPAFVVEAGNLVTESIALFLLTWMMALWLENIDRPDWRLMAATGSLLAIAALTRSVFLGFLAIPLIHLLIRVGLRHTAWRRTLRYGSMLILSFLLTVAPWTLYNLVQWNRLTLTGEGLMGTLYVGAAGWKDPVQVDAELGFSGDTQGSADYAARQEAYAQGFVQTVLADPVGYLTRRIGELGSALLQPHNTNVFPGESLKELALHWLREDRSLDGLRRLVEGESFWPKLALYVFHYAAMLLGLLGLMFNLRRWRALWPLYATCAYFLGIHLVLAAIPRYLFPLEPFWVLFTAAFLVARHRSRPGPIASQA